jgi:hypothetical protein
MIACLIFSMAAMKAAVAAARARWVAAKEAGHSLTYWQQTPAAGRRRQATRQHLDPSRRRPLHEASHSGTPFMTDTAQDQMEILAGPCPS